MIGSDLDLAASPPAHSPQWESLSKSQLHDYQGLSYKIFKNSLKPRWLHLWLEIGAGYLALAGIAWTLLAFGTNTVQPLLILVGAFAFGFTHAYLQLFFHEAAHFNIAANRKWNDRLANALIGIWVGQDIAQYRLIHFSHHRLLGTVEDTERTYFDPLNIRFIIESLLMIRTLKVLQLRKKAAPLLTPKPVTSSRSLLFLGLALHGLILSSALYFHQWSFILAWSLGLGIVFPFFAALRQVLEHRDINASSQIDYETIGHGEVHRLFGDSLLARTLGGAGFNRHLLHHWEPQLSCTQLKALEKFLLNTEAAPLIRSHQTTYTKTFFELMRAP